MEYKTFDDIIKVLKSDNNEQSQQAQPQPQEQSQTMVEDNEPKWFEAEPNQSQDNAQPSASGVTETNSNNADSTNAGQHMVNDGQQVVNDGRQDLYDALNDRQSFAQYVGDNAKRITMYDDADNNPYSQYSDEELAKDSNMIRFLASTAQQGTPARNRVDRYIEEVNKRNNTKQLAPAQKNKDGYYLYSPSSADEEENEFLNLNNEQLQKQAEETKKSLDAMSADSNDYADTYKRFEKILYAINMRDYSNKNNEPMKRYNQQVKAYNEAIANQRAKQNSKVNTAAKGLQNWLNSHDVSKDINAEAYASTSWRNGAIETANMSEQEAIVKAWDYVNGNTATADKINYVRGVMSNLEARKKGDKNAQTLVAKMLNEQQGTLQEYRQIRGSEKTASGKNKYIDDAEKQALLTFKQNAEAEEKSNEAQALTDYDRATSSIFADEDDMSFARMRLASQALTGVDYAKLAVNAWESIPENKRNAMILTIAEDRGDLTEQGINKVADEVSSKFMQDCFNSIKADIPEAMVGTIQNALSNSIVGTLTQGVLRSMNPNAGEVTYQSLIAEKQADWANKNTIGMISSTALQMVLDAPAFSVLGKGANIATKTIAKPILNRAVAGRWILPKQFSNSIYNTFAMTKSGQLALGVTQGALLGAMFSPMQLATQSFATGQTFSVGDYLSTAATGALHFGAMGVTPFISNGMSKWWGNKFSGTGKVSTIFNSAGQVAIHDLISPGVNATLVTAIENVSDIFSKGISPDLLTEWARTYGEFLGFHIGGKVAHITRGNLIKNLRQMYGHQTQLSRSVFTDTELKSLRNSDAIKEIQRIIRENEQLDDATMNKIAEQHKLIIEDTSIPEAVKMKLFAAIGNSAIATPTIADCRIEKDGKYSTVSIYTADGKLFSQERYTSAKAAQNEKQRIDGYIKVNNINMLEGAYNQVWYSAINSDAIETMSRETGNDANTIVERLDAITRKRQSGERLSEEENAFVKSFGEFFNDAQKRNENAETDRILNASDVKDAFKKLGKDVDAILSKMPWQWSEAEAEVIDRYTRRMQSDVDRFNSEIKSNNEKQVIVNELDDISEQSYNTTDAESMNALLIELNIATAEAEKEFGGATLQEILDNPVEAIQRINTSLDYTDVQRAKLNELCRLQVRMNAMVRRVNDDIHNELEQSRQAIEQLTNKQTDEVIEVELTPKSGVKEGTKVYVINGQLHTYGEGVVDYDKSDKSIAIYIEGEGKKMVPPSQIVRVVSRQSADEAINAQAQEIVSRHSAEADAKFNATIPAQVGYKFPVLLDDEERELEIVEQRDKNGNPIPPKEGNVFVNDNGNVIEMPIDALTNMANALKAQRIAEERAKRYPAQEVKEAEKTDSDINEPEPEPEQKPEPQEQEPSPKEMEIEQKENAPEEKEEALEPEPKENEPKPEPKENAPEPKENAPEPKEQEPKPEPKVNEPEQKEEVSSPKYEKGEVVLNIDGEEKIGYINGKKGELYEYYVQGEDNFRYATEKELDSIVKEYTQDKREDVLDKDDKELIDALGKLTEQKENTPEKNENSEDFKEELDKLRELNEEYAENDKVLESSNFKSSKEYWDNERRINAAIDGELNKLSDDDLSEIAKNFGGQVGNRAERILHKRKVDSLMKLSDEDLLEIVDEKGELWEEARDILDGMEYAKSDIQRYNELLDEQGEISGKAKKSYSLYKYIDKKERPQLRGVYHKDGYAIATDTHVLVADRRKYDKANDGKIIDKDGNEIEGRFPNVFAVVPRRIISSDIDAMDLLNFIAGVKAIVKSKNEKLKYKVILFNVGGELWAGSVENLEKFANAAVSLGGKIYFNDNVGTGIYTRPIYTESDKGFALMMPIDFTRNSIDKDTYFAYNPSKKGAETESMFSNIEAGNGGSEKYQLADEQGKDIQQMSKEQEADAINPDIEEKQRVQELTEEEKSSMKAIASHLGVDLIFEDNAPYNGVYRSIDEETNKPTIRISRRATNPLDAVFGHEILHRLRKVSSAAYNEMLTAVRVIMGDDAFYNEAYTLKRLYAENKENPVAISDKTAGEEVVANFVGSLIHDKAHLSKLVYKLSHPVLSSIRDAFSDFLNYFRRGGLSYDASMAKGALRMIDRAFADVATKVETKVATNKFPFDKIAESEDDAKYQITGESNSYEKSLIGVHNITEDKLIKAIKQGGFANPSLAVIDTKNGMHSDYGKISLIPKSSLIDSKTGKNAGTFAGDAWTPTYPQVEKQMSENGVSMFYKDIQKVSNNDSINNELSSVWRNYMVGGDPDKLSYWFLQERGIEPENVYINSGYTEEQRNKFAKLTDNGSKRFEDMSEAERNGIISLMAEKDGVSIEEELEKYQHVMEVNKRVLEKGKASPIRKASLQKQINEIEKYGVTLTASDYLMSLMKRALKTHGELDVDNTLKSSHDKVVSSGLQEEFDKWLIEKEEKYGVKEMLFDGFDLDGNRKYIPHTLENASKMMNRESETNSYGATGFSPTRAVLLKKMRTLEEIRKNKDKLKSVDEETKQQYDDAQSEMSSIVSALSDMQKITDNPFFNIDYANQRLQEAITKKDPIEWLNKEYGYEIDKNGDFAKGLTDLIENLQNLPVKYFETKFNRPVSLGEFAIAIVPDGTSKNVIDALKKSGIEVRMYDGTEEGRTSATMNAILDRDDIRFQLRGTPEQKFSDTDSQSKSREAQSMSRRMNVPVRIVDDTEYIFHDNRAEENRRKNSKGYYDSLAGEVVVVAPNNETAGDVVNTVFHETVAHKGLRDIAGEDYHERFIGMAYGSMSDAMRSRINSNAYDAIMEGKYDDWTQAKNSEISKVLSDLSQKDFAEFTEDEIALWKRLREHTMNVIEESSGIADIRGYASLNDTELRYMLWKDNNNVNSSVERDAIDTAMRIEYGLDDDTRYSLNLKPTYKSNRDAVSAIRDEQLPLEDRIAIVTMRMSDKQKQSKKIRNDAVKKVAESLYSINSAISAQREHDKLTANRIVALIKEMIAGNFLSNIGKKELKELFGAVPSAIGERKIESKLEPVFDVLVNNMDKDNESLFNSLISTKAKKVDKRGVEVQGTLDAEGQQMLEALNIAKEQSKDKIEQMISEAQNYISEEENEVLKKDASNKLSSYILALQYARDIRPIKAEIDDLKTQIKILSQETGDAKKNAKATINAIKVAIRQLKIQRIEAYQNLIGQLSKEFGESVGKAKEFKEMEKQRVQEIHHNANSDMQGRSHASWVEQNYTLVSKVVNNSAFRILFSPLSSFDQMMRMFGRKSANGEGYLWNRYVRGWVECREKELSGFKEKMNILDEKVKELFPGRKGPNSITDMIKWSENLPKSTVEYWNGEQFETRKLSQGNLMYIYMASKMIDGKMKLAKMGITDEDVARIKQSLDPRIIQMADWIQEELLPKARVEYNETHKRLFGAPMASIENYFPLKILKTALEQKEEDLDVDNTGAISETTNAFKRRTVNVKPLDIVGTNALNLVVSHLSEMEHINAFGEWNRDLNTLRTYNRFRNQVMNMKSVYGSGEVLWREFNKLCQIAAGTYKPQSAIGGTDSYAVNIAKGYTASRIAFRAFTAAKQLASIIAYLPDVSVSAIAKSAATAYSSFQWSMDNLPLFKERWQTRIAGDPRLLKTEKDWSVWSSKAMELSSKYGMLPNAFVDAVTVAIGAKAIYDTRYKKYFKQYKKSGATDDDAKAMADKKAKQDATIMYNSTQQSNEAIFLSPIQVDRTWHSVMMSIFRNSPFSYTRQTYDAIRNLKRSIFDRGYRKESIEFMTKQLMREQGLELAGVTEEQYNIFRDIAKKNYDSEIRRGLLRLATFGFACSFLWELYSKLPQLTISDDDEQNKEIFRYATTKALFSFNDGLYGGDVQSTALQAFFFGGGTDDALSTIKNSFNKSMPFTQSITDIAKKLCGERQAEGLSDLISLAVATGTGVDVKTIGDMVYAVMDACGDDIELSKEAMIFIMRVTNTPQSQIDQVYFEEVGMTGKEASKLTPEQLAKRYAEYKVKRGTMLIPSGFVSQKLYDSREQYAYQQIKERYSKRENPDIVEKYMELDKRIDEIGKQKNDAINAISEGKFDSIEKLSEFAQSRDYRMYEEFGQFRREFNKLVNFYMESKSPKEAEYILNAIAGIRKDIATAYNMHNQGNEEMKYNYLQDAKDKFIDFYDEYAQMRPDIVEKSERANAARKALR